MGIKYGRGWGGARISLSRGSVLSREYFPSSFCHARTDRAMDGTERFRFLSEATRALADHANRQSFPRYGKETRNMILCVWPC